MAKGPWYLTLSSDARLQAATGKTHSLFGLIHKCIEIHEANRLIVYSDTLSKQIPPSRAANAFNEFQDSRLFYEIVRVCALWDKPAKDRESIPTIVALVDDPAVLDLVRKGLVQSWHDSDLDGKPQFEEFSATLVEKNMRALAEAIKACREIESSERIKRLFDFRHQYLAHSLENPGSTDETAARVNPKYGDETVLLDAAVEIGRSLNQAIRNVDSAFDQSVAMAQKNAHSLWGACTFNIVGRAGRPSPLAGEGGSARSAETDEG